MAKGKKSALAIAKQKAKNTGVASKQAEALMLELSKKNQDIRAKQEHQNRLNRVPENVEKIKVYQAKINSLTNPFKAGNNNITPLTAVDSNADLQFKSKAIQSLTAANNSQPLARLLGNVGNWNQIQVGGGTLEMNIDNMMESNRELKLEYTKPISTGSRSKSLLQQIFGNY